MPNSTAKKAKSPKTSEKTTSAKKRFKILKRNKTTTRPPRPETKLSSSFRLFMDSGSLLRQHWKLFGGITVVYLLLSVVLVGALSSGYDITELRQEFTNEIGQLSANAAVLGILVGTLGNAASESGAAYQTIVIMIISLATIWSLRQVLAGEKPSVRDAFYKGMHPLVPFVLILLVIAVQLLPFLLAILIYGAVFGGGMVFGLTEQMFWLLVVAFLIVMSLRFVISSIMALYVVTLPDTKPIQALRISKKLVTYRRWQIFRKLLILPFILLIIAALIMFPLISLVPSLVQFAFVAYSLMALIFAHTYAYNIYKELL